MWKDCFDILASSSYELAVDATVAGNEQSVHTSIHPAEIKMHSDVSRVRVAPSKAPCHLAPPENVMEIDSLLRSIGSLCDWQKCSDIILSILKRCLLDIIPNVYGRAP